MHESIVSLLNVTTDQDDFGQKHTGIKNDDCWKSIAHRKPFEIVVFRQFQTSSASINFKSNTSEN